LARVSFVRTSVLDVAYEQSGPPDALPVVLLHGYPYDARAFDDLAPLVNEAGFRTIVPYLRGYGATRFVSPDIMRSGEQAAVGQDLLELLDALKIRQAVLAGFDWGARAACIVAALWPQRVAGLVTCAGYQIQDLAQAGKPADPEQERRFWYQHYFQTERGRRGLAEKRADLGRLLWKLWSPTWAFDEGDISANRRILRQFKFCRRGHPLLSPSHGQCGRRSTLCVCAGAIGGAAQDRHSDHSHSRRRR
jgi:pimeloyl-ACP methyl ester carboxylesterase